MVGVKSKIKLKAGVRDLAVAIEKKGGLKRDSVDEPETGKAAGHQPNFASEIHQLIQEKLSETEPGYQSEVFYSGRLSYKHLELSVTGRCDGLFRLPENGVLLEEIKTSYQLSTLEKTLLEDAEHPYRLQLLTYGYLHYLKFDQLPELRLKLVCSKTMREIIVDLSLDVASYKKWLDQRLDQILVAYKHQQKIIKRRKSLSTFIEFPYSEPRPQQKELMSSVRSALESKKHLILQAPTGLGKTAGVCIPALQSSLAKGAPLIYVAPKNSQFKEAVALAENFHKRNIKLKVLVITSKQKACLADKLCCHEAECPYAESYYDKIAASDPHKKRARKHLWDRSLFYHLAESFRVCPYELSMESIGEADLIIADYNYLFSPRANLLERYHSPIIKRPKPYLIIDEAHNLYQRVMDNYSPELSLGEFDQLKALAAEQKDEAAFSLIDQAMNFIRGQRPRHMPSVIEIEELESLAMLSEIQQLMLERLSQGQLPSAEEAITQCFNLWSEFTAMLAYPRIEAPTVYTRIGKHEGLKVVCSDPSVFIAPILSELSGVVAFSATLKPFDFYLAVSGFDPDKTECIEFISPFPREHKKIMIIPQIKTSFRHRVYHYDRIAAVIERIIQVKPAHYMVFFPSYDFLNKIAQRLKLSENSWRICQQKPGLTHKEFDAVMTNLEPGAKPTLVLAVQGGSFAEGIDYKGRGIHGVFVVGPAIPSFTFERKLIARSFDVKYQHGDDFAFTYPAMAKSIQAAGRVVRGMDETGIIVMLGERFLEPNYQKVMPSDWFHHDAKELVSNQIISDITSFWKANADQTDIVSES
jgi:DNA excision repair protein ERCC-2